MGNPPKRIVLNKLIRRYFKGQGRLVQSDHAVALKRELIDCWEQNGVDHPKCDHLKAKYDLGWAIDLNDGDKFKQQVKQYPSVFNKFMAPQYNKMYDKGTASTGYQLHNKPFRMPKY